MIYDVIVALKAGPYHGQLAEYSRYETDKIPTIGEVRDKMLVELHKFITSNTTAPDLDEIKALVIRLETFKEEVLVSQPTAFKDVLEGLSYYGLDVYHLRRDDARNAMLAEVPVRGFLISTREYHRNSSAVTIGVGETFKSSIADVTMNLLQSKIGIDPVVSEILSLDHLTRMYEVQADGGDGYQFDYEKILAFILGKGYEIKVYNS